MVEGNQISVRNKGYCFTINAINSYRAHMSKISAYSTVSSWLNTVKLKMLLKSWAMRLSVWFPCLELKDASRNQWNSKLSPGYSDWSANGKLLGCGRYCPASFWQIWPNKILLFHFYIFKFFCHPSFITSIITLSKTKTQFFC